jgi:hypothetical protein
VRRPGRPTGAAPRGVGRGRRDRRALRHGGETVAGELNRIVSGWEQVRITPLFGRFGYFVGDEMFGCYPIRPKSHDLWIRLSVADQARALGASGIRPHRRFASRGWIECDLGSPEVLPRAIRWLRRAHELAVRRTGGTAW